MPLTALLIKLNREWSAIWEKCEKKECETQEVYQLRVEENNVRVASVCNESLEKVSEIGMVRVKGIMKHPILSGQ